MDNPDLTNYLELLNFATVDNDIKVEEDSEDSERQNVQQLRSQETLEQEIGEIAAEFRTGTEREHRRIRTLMYETDILETVLEVVSPNDIFYDIGANIGIYTCFVGQKVDRIVGFEPHEETATRLRENALLNAVDIDILEYALADYEGTRMLSHPQRSPHDLGTGEFSVAPIKDADEIAEVDVISVDTMIEREDLPKPTIAKVDVEGAELQVLDGAETALDSCRELFVEVHLDHVTVDDVISRLTDANFEVETLKERGNTMFLRGTASRGGESGKSDYEV